MTPTPAEDTAALEKVTQTTQARHTIPTPVLVRGTGLLGTSIGLGLRAAGLEVLLSDPSPSALAVAQDIGAGTILDSESAAATGRQPGTVVVAAPPDVAGEEIIRALEMYPSAVVLDIASVKGAIAEQVHRAVIDQRITASQASRYVGTHPMAGRERSGPVAARGALFTAAPWVICAEDSTRPDSVAAAEDLARLLGATVFTMTAAEHDDSVALISHLPQIAASLLASRLQDTSTQALSLAGNGLRDTTRIAASDPQLWVQILTANAPQIAPILHGMREDLDRLITTLENPTADGSRLDVAQLISEGNRGQARIPGKHGAPPQAFSVVTVLVDDTPGQIVAVLTDVAEAGINVEDLRLDHSAGYEVGMLEMSVVPGRKEKLVEELTNRGWKVV
ncbi:prephenate dehydrogenase [Citricoccus sp. NR2]|uniref:prephenate dehydrogenase n=1 Tax=Citricoccus sp. NR2 TaxID=3004095 RepID=UPI0022DDF1D6|nr:prephenate dehydrogenase [Citricoccus sp. NR2]WBL18042.1 prephenate dehydrogenase [Citricoccus sp. NR2]